MYLHVRDNFINDFILQFIVIPVQVFQIADPTSDERRAFFHDLFLQEAVQRPKPKKSSMNI